MRTTWVVACALALLVTLAAGAQAARYDGGEVIVRYADGVTTTERAALFDRTGATKTLGAVRGVGAKVLLVDGDPAKVAARLNRSRLVQYAEPNRILRATAIPNDSRFGELWGFDNGNDADIDAPEGWDAAGLGAFPAAGGVRIGIVDTGIDQAHPDLSGQTVACAQSRGLLGVFAGTIAVGQCADDNDHGTHVAGTIAAKANNGTGVAGVAFNADLVICKALGGPLGTGSTADVANCINWVASQGARVISMSLGGGDSTTLRNAVLAAWSNGNGALVVAAAGNDGDATLNYPAAYAEVVSVAATDSADARASFSNANSDVEIAAPGVDVLSTIRGGGYDSFSGSSMATPHVAGVAGVLRQLFPSDSAAAIRSRLTSTVDDLGPAGRDSSFGYGRVNLCSAVGGGC
jgi:thermitase